MSSRAFALLSVSDKTGLVEFARALTARFELVATGGTLAHLQAHQVPVRSVQSLTATPELLGGRVKTLHPAVFAGILARPNEADLAEVLAAEWPLFGLVAVNLYPFGQQLAAQADEAALTEHIDIGGVALMRAAAKNHVRVWLASSPEHYPEILAALEGPPEAQVLLRRQLAGQAFARCAAYDAQISQHLLGDALPLRYGENPHQAAHYQPPSDGLPFEQLGGKELSYNNLLDLEAAVQAVHELSAPAAVIVKHGSPCGMASAPTLELALSAALAGDPVSAFGGIIALNRTCEVATLESLGSLFVELIAAPDFHPDALAHLQKTRRNCRILKMKPRASTWTLRSVLGGVLRQEPDTALSDIESWEIRASQAPDEALLQFGECAVKHLKSNAIAVVLREGDTFSLIGAGAGQTNRVDAVQQALSRAQSQGERFQHGCEEGRVVLASDAFFPFSDSIERVAQAQIPWVLQPGGSVRDQEVLAAAEQHQIGLVLTKMRHFKH